MTLSAPEPINAGHNLADFDSEAPELDSWLRKRALSNQKDNASRTYVVTDGQKVVAYYAIASGSIEIGSTPGRFRRNMPNPIPVAILARLAVDKAYKGQGLGRALFRDSGKRIIAAADILGIRGLVVHAISEDAKAFYLALGLLQSPLEPMTLMTTLADLIAAV